MARECIFCGGSANSREDVWPCWLTSRFVAPGTMEQERGPDLRMTSWRVDRPELVVKRVCKTCNNRWMSQLQCRAKPVIERLWDQTEVTLDLSDCKALSSWAAMTSMTLQTFDEADRWLYTDYDRTLMWHEQRIPSFIGIWIANCIGHTRIQTPTNSSQIRNSEEFRHPQIRRKSSVSRKAAKAWEDESPHHHELVAQRDWLERQPGTGTP